MKKFILVLAAVACMGFVSAQTVYLATVAIVVNNEVLGVMDTIPLSNNTLPAGQGIRLSQINFGAGTAAYALVGIKNNTSSTIPAGDSLKISVKFNGTELLSYTMTLKANLEADSITAAYLDGIMVGDYAKGGLNVINYSISKYNDVAVNDAGDDIYVILSAQQSIVENALSNVSIYPNPARNILNVNNVENANVNIYAINGQLVKSMANVSGNAQVDLSDMAAGMYIVRMQSGNDVRTEKIQVVK